MGDARRQIELKITGQAVKNGRVPLCLLTQKLNCTQEALYQIATAKAVADRDLSRGGRIPGLVKRQCELFLVETGQGSFSARLELPPPVPELFDLFPDLAEQSLSEFREAVEGVAIGDRERLARILPDQAARRVVVNTVYVLLPAAKDDYGLDIGLAGKPTLVGLARPPKDSLRTMIGPIEPSAEPSQAALTMIRATCLARFDAAGKPDIDKVLEYEILADEHQYRPAQIAWGVRAFSLEHEIACAVTFEDDLWVVEYEPLGIRAYAETRGQAIQEFDEEFAAVWDAYASVPDDQLTDDAIDLKQRLMSLVVSEVSHGQ